MKKRQQCYLDRFEGGLAVLVCDGGEIAVPAKLMPAEAREGDYLFFTVEINEQRRDEVSGEISDVRRQLNEKDGNNG